MRERERPLILVVDDDAVGRMICCDVLSENGFDVIEAEDGEQALERFYEDQPDLILLDVVMDRMDGFETCAELRRQAGGSMVPVLMMTGLEDIASIERAYELGATDFITKPFNWTVLIHRVRYILRADLSMNRLRTAERDLSEAQRIAALGGFRWTAGERAVTLSREATVILGLPSAPESISPRRVLRTLARSERSRLLAALRANLRGARAFSLDCRLADTSRGARTVTIRGEAERPLPGRYGAVLPARIVVKGTVQEISERKRLEETLQIAKERAEVGNAAKTAFLAIMSHELRTPLNAVIGFAEILEGYPDTPVSPAKVSEYASQIAGSGRHLLQLIADILQVSQLEGSEVELELGTIDVPSLLRQTLRAVRERGMAESIACEFAIEPGLPYLFADERRLRQVLLNLLSNAFKFSKPGGRVTIAAETRIDGSMAIEIRDTGVGMSAEDCRIAVQPFRQAGHWLTRRHEGSGLGLSIAKALVEAHGGSFTLDSVLGEGTVAGMVFPPDMIATDLLAEPPQARRLEVGA